MKIIKILLASLLIKNYLSGEEWCCKAKSGVTRPKVGKISSPLGHISIMGSLYGTYRVSLDIKKRLAIPAKLRYAFPEKLRNQIFITRGIEKCITGFDWDEWAKFQTILNKLKIDETTKRKIKRQFIGRASEEVFDKQGRIILPADLAAYAELQECDEVLVIGTGNMLEIWNPKVYEADGAASEEIIQKTMGEISLEFDDFFTPEIN